MKGVVGSRNGEWVRGTGNRQKKQDLTTKALNPPFSHFALDAEFILQVYSSAIALSQSSTQN